MTMTPWRIACAVIGIVLVLIYAGGANYWNQPDGWYQSLQKPSWQPPGYLFGIIWPYNFVVIGISLYTIAAQARPLLVAMALSLFAASVFFALRWSYLFYFDHDFSAAGHSLLITTILTLPILAIISSVSWKIALAFIPYQVWIGIATALNYEYGKINITQ
jgi:tryptophan-rich sensory protein